MNRLVVLLLAITLTACAPSAIGPAVYITAPPIGPAELQRAADAATNTAVAQQATSAAVATQAAQATVGELSARATSTTAAQLTRDALQVEQTRAALQLTVSAGQGLATDAAAVRTQAARQTQAWATPTAAAVRTQAAVSADDARQEHANAESAAQFWELLRWTILAAIAGVVIVTCVLILVRGIAFIYTEAMRERAAVAREAFKVLAPGHWAEWTPADGYHVYPLPGLLDAPPTIVENTPTQPNVAYAWRQAVRLFAHWGDRYGFGIRELGASGAGVVSDPAWRALSKLLKDAGVLADVRRDGQRGRVTAWAEGWDYRRLAHEVTYGPLALPFPEQGDVPKVTFAVPTQHQN